MVPLAAIIRSGMQESVHYGAAAVIGPDGRLRRGLGDTSAPMYPRSTLKFLQAVAVLESGVELEGAELVIAAASHSGTPAHVALVESILARAGLDESALQCPLDWPSDSTARGAASGPRRLTMTCSGKHAAFLLACVHNGWDTSTYLTAEHPLQRRIRTTIEEFAGEAVMHVGVDGCGAPVFALSLEGLARAVGSVARGSSPEAARLTKAVAQDSWALENAALARVIDELGLIAKSGAEGVYVAGASDGTAVAVKVSDGSARALLPVTLELLRAEGVVDSAAVDAVLAATTERVLGGGQRVGELVVLV